MKASFSLLVTLEFKQNMYVKMFLFLFIMLNYFVVGLSITLIQ